MADELVPRIDVPLSVQEQQQLADLEQVIEDGLNVFFKVGAALAMVRDTGLYRQYYPTFEAYCQKRWDFERRYAYRLIAAASVIENVSHGTHQLPANERQARELAKLPPGEQRQAWQAVLERTNGKPTAKDITIVVRERLPPVLPPETPKKLVDVTTVQPSPVQNDNGNVDDMQPPVPGQVRIQVIAHNEEDWERVWKPLSGVGVSLERPKPANPSRYPESQYTCGTLDLTKVPLDETLSLRQKLAEANHRVENLELENSDLRTALNEIKMRRASQPEIDSGIAIRIRVQGKTEWYIPVVVDRLKNDLKSTRTEMRKIQEEQRQRLSKASQTLETCKSYVRQVEWAISSAHLHRILSSLWKLFDELDTLLQASQDKRQ